MRLESTKAHRHKPLEHQRPMANPRGRPRTKMKEFAREGACALKIRVKARSGEAVWSAWRWMGSSGGYTEQWFERHLFSMARARSLAAEMKHLDGHQVRVVIVWRKAVKIKS